MAASDSGNIGGALDPTGMSDRGPAPELNTGLLWVVVVRPDRSEISEREVLEEVESWVIFPKNTIEG